MRKRSKYKSIKHNYCKYCLAKCFIFLHKNTMKLAWEPATKLLNKDNFWPCRYLRLTSEGSIWAKRNREKWSWPPRRSPYLSFLGDFQLETKSYTILKPLWRALSWTYFTQREGFSISSLELNPVVWMVPACSLTYHYWEQRYHWETRCLLPH